MRPDGAEAEEETTISLPVPIMDECTMLARATTYCPMSLSSMSLRSMSLALRAKGEEQEGGGRKGAEAGAGARSRLLGESMYEGRA